MAFLPMLKFFLQLSGGDQVARTAVNARYQAHQCSGPFVLFLLSQCHSGVISFLRDILNILKARDEGRTQILLLWPSTVSYAKDGVARA